MIYLYDVTHYAHTRTSVPTSARTHKEKKKKNTLRATRTPWNHSFCSVRTRKHTHTHTHADAHTHMHEQAHIRIHTHARAYIHTYVGARARHTHIHITSLCERRRTTNETSIHVYVCTCTYSEYLTNVFYRDFNRFISYFFSFLHYARTL